MAHEWLTKDRMDAGALVALSAIAALEGDPDRSRDLLASAVDADPANAKAHERVMIAYRNEGDRDLFCAHAVTHALLDGSDWKRQVKAARCTRDNDRFVAGLKKKSQRGAERALRKDPKPLRRSDKLTVDASWTGDADVDIVVVTPKGRVISRHGGAKRVASHGSTHDKRQERLAASVEELGRYSILVVRRNDGEPAPTLQGQLKIRSYGKTRKVPFVLDGTSTQVAELRVQSSWRYERVR